ncbi:MULTISPECIES: hypothetical protein [unclassified Cupriavidus]|nr:MULTISPECIES: hypothetical protein [unclassified Cupriavidus]
MRRFFYRLMTESDLQYKVITPILYAMGVYALGVNVWMAYLHYTR